MTLLLVKAYIQEATDMTHTEKTNMNVAHGRKSLH